MGGGTWAPLRNVVLMNLYERLVQSWPIWSAYVQTAFCRRKPRPTEPTPPRTSDPQAEIVFERLAGEKQSKAHVGQQATLFQNRMDSVIHTVSKVPQIRHLLSITTHDYLPHEFEPIRVDSDVYFQLQEIRHADGVLERLLFRIFCYDHDAKHLQAYVEQCNATYDRHMANKLGTNLYYFDMMVQSKQSSRSGLQNPLPTQTLLFTKHRFQTSRTFSNVFFEQRADVEAHTRFFLDRKDWYEQKGIPHTLGFMFHGEPGCGKTSTIKAIANVAHRHIINLQLSEIKSKDQLRNLFFNDELQVYDNGKTERYTIPVNERMYVIEDIDAMGDIVLRREWKQPDAPKQTTVDELGFVKEVESNPIDLSFLLNLLDGTLETSGRILAISTNFPERIDRALIRPGRIDMILHFKKCSRAILREMVESFYDHPIESTCWDDAAMDEKWTPAEVNQILFRNFKDSDKALRELHTFAPSDLYGFELMPVPESSPTTC